MDEKILYLDCASGISGDMTVGALLDLGASREKLVRALDSLGVSGYHLHFGRTKKCGIDAYDFDVHLEEEEHHHDHEHSHDEHNHSHDEHDHSHDEYDHEHHHEHGENCTCGCHDHDHEHHHHHADEVFTSWGKETPHKFTKAKIEDVLKTLCETDDYGTILRAKGMVEDENGSWIYFDMVPGEYELRDGEPDYTGRLCVIGTDIDEHRLEELFGIA